MTSKHKKGGKRTTRKKDSWGPFAAAVLAFLIVFHIVNNYIVLRQDTVFFQGELETAYRNTVGFLEGLSNERLFEMIDSVYRDTSDHYPSLFVGTAALLLALFGYSRDVAVMGNAPFIAVLLISTYLLGKMLFNRETGLIAAILVSFFPGLISISRTYRADLALAAMVTLSVLFLAIAEHRSKREGILLGLILGLTALTKPTSALFLVVPALLFIGKPLLESARAGKSGNIKRLVLNISLIVAVTTLIAGPWYAIHSGRNIGSHRETLPKSLFALEFKGLGSFLSDFLEVNPLMLLSLHTLKAGTLLFAIGIVYLLRRQMKHKALLLGWIVLPYIFFLTFEYVEWFWLPRHLIPILPAVALVMAIPLARGPRWLSGRIPRLAKSGIITVILLLLTIEIPLFLAITYAGSGTLESPFGNEEIGRERIYRTSNLGILSPYDIGFDIEEISDMLEEEWSSQESAPGVFFLNPDGFVTSDGLLSEMQLRNLQANVDFTESNCFPAWHDAQSENKQTCEEIFDSSDYAVIEPIRYDEMGFEGMEDAYSKVVCPTVDYIERSLGSYEVLMVLDSRISYTSPYEVRHPCFDWLNESIWILKKNE